MIKFSIIIPTADRHYLLEHTVRACLMIKRDDIEVIVSDNFSSPETKSIVERYQDDKRLKYFRTDRRLPIPEHWDFAWSKARGDFVIINCDDDFLSPSGLEAIDRAIQRFDVELVSWHIAAYHHPDYEAEGAPNTLHFPVGHSNLQMLLDPKEVIAAYARFHFRFRPEATRSCISKQLGDKILKLTGRLFWAPSPDFSAPLLALACTNRYCYIDSALGFGGRSKHSNAASYIKTSASQRSNRVEEFLSEFSDEDSKFPYHALKIPFYANFHLAPISVLKKYYPEFKDIKIDWSMFFRSAYEELLGVRYSPVIDISMESSFAKYISELDAEAQDTAARIRAQVAHPRRWSMPQRKDILRSVARTITPTVVKIKLRTLLATDVALIKKIPGRRYGFNNSFDICTMWDQIVSENECFSLANVRNAMTENLVVSAHVLDRS